MARAQSRLRNHPSTAGAARSAVMALQEMRKVTSAVTSSEGPILLDCGRLLCAASSLLRQDMKLPEAKRAEFAEGY